MESINETFKQIRESLKQMKELQGQKIGKMIHYSELEVIAGTYSEQDVILVPLSKQDDPKQRSYKIYQGMKEIATVNEDGLIILQEDYVAQIESNIEKLGMDPNLAPSYLTIIQDQDMEVTITSKSKPEEVREKVNTEGRKKAKEIQYNHQTEHLDTGGIEQRLEEDGIKSKVTRVLDITDEQFYKIHPECNQYRGISTRVQLIYLQDGTEMFVGEKDGSYDILSSPTQSKRVNQEVYKMDAEGRVTTVRLNNIIMPGKEDLGKNQNGDSTTLEGTSFFNTIFYATYYDGKKEPHIMAVRKDGRGNDIGTDLETKDRYPMPEKSKEVEDMMNPCSNPDMRAEGKKVEQYSDEGRKGHISAKEIEDNPETAMDKAEQEILNNLKERGISIDEEVRESVRTSLRDAKKMGRAITGKLISDCTRDIAVEVTREPELEESQGRTKTGE